MKRLFCLALALVCLSLGACGGTAATSPETQPTEDLYKNAYHKTNPSEDDTLYILTMGSSNSYYFLDELHGMLAAAGIKAKVCSLMRSNTSILDYHKYWKSEETVFQLVIHDENGETVMESMNLDMALRTYNFDVLNMHEWGWAHRQGKAPQTVADERATAYNELVAYIREKCPGIKLYHHENFALDIGFESDSYKMETVEQRAANQKDIRDYTEIVCEKFGMEIIPCGRAWTIARENPMCERMTARLAKTDDYAHDGDVGGGQFLNASVWFEVITGQSCVGNTFRPVYEHEGQEHTLSEEMITVLQNAAHQAVEELKTDK